jgi:hypothetical protein
MDSRKAADTVAVVGPRARRRRRRLGFHDLVFQEWLRSNILRGFVINNKWLRSNKCGFAKTYAESHMASL